MRCLGRLIALSLALGFVVLWPCSMWTFNTQRIALSGDLYKELFTDEGFYQELIPAVLPAFIEDLDTQPAPGELSLYTTINQMDYRAWEPIASGVVPAEWVKNEVEANLDEFFTWLDGHDSELTLVFNTEPLRRRLIGEPGRTAVEQMIATFPDCTPQQATDQAAFFAGDLSVQFPYCQPVDPAGRALFFEALWAATGRVAEQLPDQVDILAGVETASQAHAQPGEATFSRASLNEFRASVRLWQRLLVLVFLVPAALLSLIVIFTVRSFKAFFRWMGWPLLVGSLLTLVPLFFLPFLMSDLRGQSQSELEAGFAAAGQLVAEVVADGMFRLVIGEFTRPILLHSTILIVLAFFSIVLSVLLRDPDAPPERPLVPAYPAGFAGPDAPTSADQTPSGERTPLPDRTPPQRPK